MKLRIKGNTIRLRLTQSEIDQFRQQGRVKEVTRFGPGSHLIYVLEARRDVPQLRARYEGSRLLVYMPADVASAWCTSDRVSVEGRQPIEDGEQLEILVEKDFQCLHKGEKDPDAFPHPEAERVQDASS